MQISTSVGVVQAIVFSLKARPPFSTKTAYSLSGLRRNACCSSTEHHKVLLLLSRTLVEIRLGSACEQARIRRRSHSSTPGARPCRWHPRYRSCARGTTASGKRHRRRPRQCCAVHAPARRAHGSFGRVADGWGAASTCEPRTSARAASGILHCVGGAACWTFHGALARAAAACEHRS